MSDDWIACSERMPAGDADVLFAHDDGEGTHGLGVGWWNSKFRMWSTPFSVRVNITHRQPLPSPPTHAAVQATTDPDAASDEKEGT